MKRSLLLSLLVFLLSLGFAGTEMLVLTSAPVHAAEEEASSEEREEQTLKKSASKRKARGKKLRSALVNLPRFFESAPTAARSRFPYLAFSQPDYFHPDTRPPPLQVFRI